MERADSLHLIENVNAKSLLFGDSFFKCTKFYSLNNKMHIKTFGGKKTFEI